MEKRIKRFPDNAGRAADVRVEACVCADNSNPRGRRSFEWRPWERENGEQREGVVFDNPQITYYYREPYEVCGNHCHTGGNSFDPDRNPEEMRFLLGNTVVELEDLWGTKATLQIDVEPGKPVSIKIPPWVKHTFHVGNRGVHYQEAKRNPFSKDPAKQDVVNEPEFRLMQAK